MDVSYFPPFLKGDKGGFVYRQKIIGNYIVDFYCPSGCLVIEVAGAQHDTDIISPHPSLKKRGIILNISNF